MSATDRLLARHHADWLALVEVAGPFLSMPVLMEYFPNELDLKENESEMRRRLRLAYDEWLDNQAGSRPDPAIHYQWLRFVLAEVLDMQPDVILEGQALPPQLHYQEHSEMAYPLLAIRSPFEPQPRLLIQLYPQTQNLAKPLPDKKASPQTRMMEMLRHTGIRLGLVTNGRSWMLVDAPNGETTGYYSWDAELWLDEPLTLRAFHSLLGMQRFFNVPESERLETLLSESMQRQQEVTERLGEQVRRAVNTLVTTLDRLDRESQRALLHSVSPMELYEAALTVMMRLVFLLSAEERELLPIKESLYEENYAVSTLHEQLRIQADQQSEEVMGRRSDAWSRLLAVFRIVYGGVEHENLRLPAYGGRLFDPDRFPFLEGRKPGTSWHSSPARPLLIDNRTVLHLLNALQYLHVPVPGGGIEPRRLSFRGLDIEQIGHVYEGLLDHTAKRATTTILGLVGKEKDEPETTLDELEAQARKGDAALLDWLRELTGRSTVTMQKQLKQPLEQQQERSRLMEACDNRQDLFQRVLPFAGLLRRDTFGDFIVITTDSFYVTHGSDRRSTGTHYTPRSLTEPIVLHALDPLVYIGPAEGLPQEQWQLRSAEDILNLKVCDMAMGSGAFLVQSCRYLSEKLVEAWDALDQQDEENKQDGQNTQKLARVTRTAPAGKPSRGLTDEELLPVDTEERLALARRIVSERCLYGVDKNPMAVEMAKLSLWLITLAKNRPFTFLDHALRHGDSLLGVNERQLLNWSLDAKAGKVTEVAWGLPDVMRRSLETAFKLRRQIAALPDRDVRDIEAKEHLLDEATRAMETVKLGADLLIAIALSDPKRRAALQDTLGLDYSVFVKAHEEAYYAPVTEQGRAPIQSAYEKLRAEVDELLKGRRPFHWPLEFPEVFTDISGKAGFDSMVGNPPFQGGQMITGTLSADYRDYLVEYVAYSKRGSADLCAYFFLRASELVNYSGQCSLLATKTIAQNITREVGLDQITTKSWSIIRAISNLKWPGIATVEIALVWLKHGDWHGAYLLDEKLVKGINSFLRPTGNIEGEPYALFANTSMCFQGTIVLGKGFILEPENADALIKQNLRNHDVLFPYLDADDINQRYDQTPSRWVINFHNWPLERAEAYPDCMKIIKEEVKPKRDLNTFRHGSNELDSFTLSD
ncbi:MAG TPA: DNA methyltransferase [Ktedonobacteraceae bacterium]|nr:DNA methyltransferase [Ktedonobacteraceae bacterium]